MNQAKAEAETLLALMEQDERIVVLAADLETSCGMSPVRERFPRRILNVGIAEQNMIGIAAGLAKEGMLPFTHTFAAFASMRACEQVRTDVFYNQLNVKIIGTHGGVSTGPAGSTHFALEDIGILRSMPMSQVVVPADGYACASLIRQLAAMQEPAYCRLDRNDLPDIYHAGDVVQFGRGNVLREGEHGLVIAAGQPVYEALQAAAILQDRQGIALTVVDMHTVKPLDTLLVQELAARHDHVFTVEEHHVIGGLGSAVSEALAGMPHGGRLVRIGFEEVYPMGGPVEVIRKRYGLDRASLALRIESVLRSN